MLPRVCQKVAAMVGVGVGWGGLGGGGSSGKLTSLTLVLGRVVKVRTATTQCTLDPHGHQRLPHHELSSKQLCHSNSGGHRDRTHRASPSVGVAHTGVEDWAIPVFRDEEGEGHAGVNDPPTLNGESHGKGHGHLDLAEDVQCHGLTLGGGGPTGDDGGCARPQLECGHAHSGGEGGTHCPPPNTGEPQGRGFRKGVLHL